MRFKVDENLPREVCDLLNRAGDEAISVGEQGLGGANDARMYKRCQDEKRALITLDADFANARAYEPNSSSGVVVLRLARQEKQRVLTPWQVPAPAAGRAAGQAAVDRREDAHQDPVVAAADGVAEPPQVVSP